MSYMMARGRFPRHLLHPPSLTGPNRTHRPPSRPSTRPELSLSSLLIESYKSVLMAAESSITAPYRPAQQARQHTPSLPCTSASACCSLRRRPCVPMPPCLASLTGSTPRARAQAQRPRDPGQPAGRTGRVGRGPRRGAGCANWSLHCLMAAATPQEFALPKSSLLNSQRSAAALAAPRPWWRTMGSFRGLQRSSAVPRTHTLSLLGACCIGRSVWLCRLCGRQRHIHVSAS